MNNFLHNSLFSGIPLTKFASASLYSDFSLFNSERLPCSTQCHPHELQCSKCFQELPCLFSFSQESVLILFNVCGHLFHKFHPIFQLFMVGGQVQYDLVYHDRKQKLHIFLYWVFSYTSLYRVLGLLRIKICILNLPQ